MYQYILAIALFFSCTRIEEEPKTKPSDDIYIPAVNGMTCIDNEAILISKIEEFIKQEIAIERNHILFRKPERLTETAKIIHDVSKTTGLDWEIIFTIIAFESKFKYNVMAKDKPTYGYMQLHGRAWSYCQEQLNRKIDKKNPKDQVLCGSIWLQHSIEECKDKLDHGIARYATGYMCDYSESISVTFIVNRRLKLINKLKES